MIFTCCELKDVKVTTSCDRHNLSETAGASGLEVPLGLCISRRSVLQQRLPRSVSNGLEAMA
jgi:hypothetical protein